MRDKFVKALGALGVLAAFAGQAGAQEYIYVGNLTDFTGATAVVGKEYGQAKIDAMHWINENGGINGKLLDFDTVDYSYVIPRAVATYKKWTGARKVAAVQGWGTGDTEALVDQVAKDQVPYYSASYSAHLTDPQGKGPNTKKPAPYNFPMGPSYSDGVRALIQWAAEDWKKQGKSGKPKFIHMGDNHPYPNAPKKAGEDFAKEAGFDVVNSIQYSMAPADFKAQCLSLKESGANYAFLANTSDSNIALLKACQTVGVQTQFMANIWGADENLMKAAGEASNGIVWVMGSAKWGDAVPGMKTVEAVSKISDPKGVGYRAVHYIRGVCAIFYMKEAMEWADKNGGVNGANIKKAMYQKKDWVPAGLEGVCPPGTWTDGDHRAFTNVLVYRGTVKGATDSPVGELMKSGAISMAKVYDANIPRKAEWLGW
jgi:branched-chain amino acid transport system substrate-binding protein